MAQRIRPHADLAARSRPRPQPGSHDDLHGRRRNQGRPKPSAPRDEVGYKAEEQTLTNHDVHASILYLMGMDHKRLTYYFNGRNMRLTDVSGELIPQITGTTTMPKA